jgi:hypothetical protein
MLQAIITSASCDRGGARESSEAGTFGLTGCLLNRRHQPALSLVMFG